MLQRRKIGCWLGGSYIGIVRYADNLFLICLLICLSAEGLQEMIKTCKEYAKEYGLTFSTDVIPSKSKTKCLKFEINPHTQSYAVR